jgi:hypothetical protein
MDIHRVANRLLHYMDQLQTKERCRDAELEVLARNITEEDLGYWHRVADRILAEAKA